MIHFLGEQWWIGGQRRSQVWYWTGVQTGKIPAYGTDQSHWYYDPKNDYDCMFLWTGGDDDTSNDGWFNNNGAGCSGMYPYICEKKF